MVHEFMASAAWISLAAIASAGYCGLRMCRAMLRPGTSGNLLREADLLTLQLANSSKLSLSHQVAVSLVLYGYGPTPALSTPPARLAGCLSCPLSYEI